MILKYDFFAKKLNSRLFEGSSIHLLDKIVKNPDRYIGLFRPTKPKTKLLQNITQSHEIKFGDALEEIFSNYFEKLGYEILDVKLLSNETKDKKAYAIDQLIKKDNEIILIEQKVRDDHDSTKKVGQFQNFETKYYEVSRKYSNIKVTPIMWFIDSSLQKNKKFYLSEMDKMNKLYDCEPKLCYGEELFNSTNSNIPMEMWNEILEYLKIWHETLPDLPEVNFDKNCDQVFEEIKDLTPSIYRKLFENEELERQILPILSPEGKILEKLKIYFISKGDMVHIKLATMINNYTSNK